MSENTPLLDKRRAADVAGEVAEALAKVTFELTGADQARRELARSSQALIQFGQSPTRQWVGQQGRAGWALVQLFGHLTELVINRLNRLPDKHFLAFLNEAGIELLPPQPSHAEVVFALGPDAPPVVRVPEGTQVATQQTETRPEIVFETEERLTVVPTELRRCIVLDPVRWADCTARAKGNTATPSEVGAFAAFEGQTERERMLFIGGDALFAFPDETSRTRSTVVLNFQFAEAGQPTADGWHLEWLYWNPVSVPPAWERLPDKCVEDSTNNFAANGDVSLRGLPEIAEIEVAGHMGRWIACRLTGGTRREHLPVVSSIMGSRRMRVDQESPAVAAVAAVTGIQANTSFVELKVSDEFMPFGPRPDRLDTFYVKSDEAFTKSGATVQLEFTGLAGVPADTASPNLEALTVVWEYYSTAGWTELGHSTRAGVTVPRLGFSDTTLAFTAGGATTDGQTGSGTCIVSFQVPVAGAADPAFQIGQVNAQAGYWVRARIVAGNYTVPAYVEILDRFAGSYRFHEPQSYTPLVKQFKVTYGDYRTRTEPRPVPLCASRVDQEVRDSLPMPDALDSGGSFASFSAREEGPALYLGFASFRQVDQGQPAAAAFPAGAWIQILFDVAEPEEGAQTPGGSGSNSYPPVAWEYWSNQGWKPLQVTDKTHDLRLRDYLGFFGPADHAASTEFGEPAFWLRGRVHHQPPIPSARGAQSVRPDETGCRVVRLDASRSQAFNREYIARYEWHLVSSETPEGAEVQGPCKRLETAGGQLGFSTGSTVDALAGAEGAPNATSQKLKGIRLNTVRALNAIVIENEVLRAVTTTEGMSARGAKASQRFALQRAPVLPDLQIEVREEEAGGAQWVPWQRVDSFYELDSLLAGRTTRSGPSRSFVLDPINGVVQFGDDRLGKIPPAGIDNIRADRYRTHNGAAGNVGVGEILVVRNPKDDLTLITGVTNPEPAVGGSDAETIPEIRQRGPQLLKHRHRAVTQGGFQWLGRESSGQIAQAFTLPARNPMGEMEPGWVSVVVVPQDDGQRSLRSGNGGRLEPSAALLRYTKTYLEGLALNTLSETASTDQSERQPSGIFLTGPEYVEARVLAHVVPQNPTQADQVEMAILERLRAFLYPLGTNRELGWELGRDVYLGDVYAEIESVPGVDHVVYLELSGSIQQHNLVFVADEVSFAEAGFVQAQQVGLVAGDGAVLVEDLRIGNITKEQMLFVAPQPVLTGSITDLTRCRALVSSAGDKRLAVAPYNLMLDDQGQVSGLRRGYSIPFNIPASSEVSTFDRRVRLLLADNLLAGDPLTMAGVYGFKAGDEAVLVSSDDTVIAANLRVAAVELREGDPAAAAAALGTQALAVRIVLEPLAGGADSSAPDGFSGCDAVMSRDGRIRLPLAPAAAVTWRDGNLVIEILCLVSGARVCVVNGSRRDPRLAFLPVQSITQPDERIIVPEGHLVYSGAHKIEMAAIDMAGEALLRSE